MLFGLNLIWKAEENAAVMSVKKKLEEEIANLTK